MDSVEQDADLGSVAAKLELETQQTDDVSQLPSAEVKMEFKEDPCLDVDQEDEMAQPNVDPKDVMGNPSNVDKETEDCILTGLNTNPGPDSIPPIGDIELPKPKAGDQMYTMKESRFSEWVSSYIVEVITKTSEDGKVSDLYKVAMSASGGPGHETEKSPHFLAYYNPPTVRVPVGTRIIAEYTANNIDSTENSPAKFFSGIVAESASDSNKYRYLVFFNDGKEQYVNHSSLRLVCQTRAFFWEYFIRKLQPFIKAYVTNYPERCLVKLRDSESIQTEYQGAWVTALVVEEDCSLFKLMFPHDGHSEWIYRGSQRLYPLFERNNTRRGLQG